MGRARELLTAVVEPAILGPTAPLEVAARHLPGEYFELNPLGTAMVGRRTGRRFRLGDPVTVRVESIDRSEGKVELRLAETREESRAKPRSPRGRR